jgi:hypothetical protein
MPRVKQNSMLTSLHYTLTDSQCSKCGGQLEWIANFNDINQPKYISQHCNQEYAVRVDSVKVEMVTSIGRIEVSNKHNREKHPTVSLLPILLS